MAYSKEASQHVFLRTQPAADDANLNEDPEEEHRPFTRNYNAWAYILHLILFR